MNTAQRGSPDPIQGFSPAGQLLHLITAYWTSQAICAAAELGIADRLGKRGRPVSDLARETACNEDALYRLLRALAASGVFAEVAPREFALTPMGALLRDAMPGNLRDFARMQADGWHWQAWGGLAASVRSGRQVLDCFDHLAQHPRSAAIFDAAMSGYSTQVHAAVVEAWDFSQAQRIIDVGGGRGALLSAVLEANPTLRGTLFDRADVLSAAPGLLGERGVADRVDLVAGDFFAQLPRGADVALLCAVIHDWDDAQATRILRQVAGALPPDGRVLIVENLIPADGEAHPGKLIDLEMLLLTGGRERTLDEYSALLANAGLRLGRVVPTAVSVSIIEGVTA